MDYKDDNHSPRSMYSDGAISISLNDSWTGRKILESIGYGFCTRLTPQDLNVCFKLIHNQTKLKK